MSLSDINKNNWKEEKIKWQKRNQKRKLVESNLLFNDKMTYKTILGVVPGLQATVLVAENIPKNFCPKLGKKIKIEGKGRGLAIGRMKRPNMVRQSIRNLLGIGLIGATAETINKLP